MQIPTTRKKWLAVLLALIMPGLGQLYCGELLRGACFLVFFIFSPLLLATITVILPDSWTFAGDAMHGAEALEDSVVIEIFSPAREDYLEL